MVVRLLAAGVALLAVAVLAGAMLSLRSEQAVPEAADTWRVIGASSAHRVLVIDIEAERPEDASDIAVQIVDPVRSRDYEEILIHIYAEGSSTGTAVRRMQWTPLGGYVETIYETAR